MRIYRPQRPLQRAARRQLVLHQLRRLDARSLTVEDIVAVDLDGKPLDGGNVKPPLEFPIHAEVYRARPKVNAVFHTHPQWSTYLP